ncbi:FMN-dependent dehydrogenase-domain-containing protein [Melampsora americana]|nr:FMN-dependent dehydrogenase-domain-containing protein [Melampsora americana]
MTQPKKISKQELLQHNDRSSCWSVIHNRVYDFTSFLDEHPGGSDVILRYAGSDATQAFDNVHSITLLKTLDPEQHIGEIEEIRTPQRRPLHVENQSSPDLSQVLNLNDIEKAAEKGLKPKAWAYYKSAANEEITVKRNQSDWNLIKLRPRILRDVSKPNLNLKTNICGFDSRFPFFIAPAALAKLAHSDGEKNFVRAAAKFGIIYIVSSNASCSLEELAECKEPGQILFYQLYVNKDRSKTVELLKRIERAGYEAIVLTVDAPIPGKRTRDERLRVSIGGEQSVSTALASQLKMAVFLEISYIDSSLTWEDASWIQRMTHLPIIIKGLQTSEDIKKSISMNFKYLYLSNHGGRQLDCTSSSLEILIEFKTLYPGLMEKSRCEVWMDGGIRAGSDVVKALALGVTAVGIGRPPLYSLLWGQQGVEKVLKILKDEIEMCLRLVGVIDINQLGLEYVKFMSIYLLSV